MSNQSTVSIERWKLKRMFDFCFEAMDAYEDNGGVDENSETAKTMKDIESWYDDFVKGKDAI